MENKTESATNMRQFDEEEALLIWEEALKYVSKEVFPDHEEGDRVAMDHMWAMGTILSYLLCGYPALKGTEDIKCYNNVGIGLEELYPVMGDRYTKHIDEVQKEDLNPFLYHCETGYDYLCNRNGHLVLTTLDSASRFKEEEVSLIWKEALDYVHYKLFLNHEKGDTYATNHTWGLGIILLYLLCGNPPLNGKSDIHCYNIIGIGPKANSQEQSKLEQDGHVFLAMEWCNLTQPVRKHIKGSLAASLP
eukprot:jgi/Psemu1/16261/gm1.16261_g